MCRPSLRRHSRHTNKFVQPPTQIETMIGFLQARAQDKVGRATFLSALALSLGGLTCTSLVQQSTSTPLTCGLLLAGWMLVALKLGKLNWETVVDYAHQVDDAVTKVSSSPTMTRIKSSVSTTSMRLVELAKGTGWGGEGQNARVERRSPQISATEPFLSLEKTADLSLSDITDLMRFALDINRLDFSSQAFLLTLNPGAREAAEAINRVLLASRGTKTALSTPSLRRGGDAADAAAADMDALAFAAAVRLYAEWRSLRLVPEGHPRYAVAMNLAKRDLVQNVQKLEMAAHRWMADREGSRQSAVDLANGRQVRISNKKIAHFSVSFVHGLL